MAHLWQMSAVEAVDKLRRGEVSPLDMVDAAAERIAAVEMARTVPDLALMLDAMAAFSTHDPLSRRAPMGGFQAAMHQGRPPLRIGFSADLGLRRVDPKVAAVCEAAVKRFGAMGTAVEGAAPDFSRAIDSFQVLRALLFADVRGDLLPAERTVLTPTSSGISLRGRRSRLARSFRRGRHAMHCSTRWHAFRRV